MKQLEDKIKDRLEGFESDLPEGDLAEFKALLDASANSGAKRSPSYIAWLIPAVVAAGLALFLVFGHSPQQDIIQVVDGSSLMADAVGTIPEEVVGLAEEELVEDMAAVQAKPSASGRITRHTATVAVNEDKENNDSASSISEQSTSDQVGNVRQTAKNEQDGEEERKDDRPLTSDIAGYSPFVPSSSGSSKPVSVEVGKATAGILGGTGALALASVLPSIIKNGEKVYHEPSTEPIGPGGNLNNPDLSVDGKTHYMPLRAGLSIRIPFTDRWSLTTGLDYSWYDSRLEYSLSGIHKQSAHYLGIPLRADFTIARNRWLDVYVGAGASADLCVAAFEDGKRIAKDGVGFSLIGAGGVQFNITDKFGLFLDPTFSWNIPSNNRVLDTYRSEHPFMFSLPFGIRINLNSKYD
ncbi:MAG: porin family protein [Bacteroidales bacterium]|nr:porin family protein [Bacteroidales bacterium]